jgi:SAM-dependent methyltransferase
MRGWIGMDAEQLEGWFRSVRVLLEDSYTAAEEPWQQSGVGLGGGRNAEYWEAVRWPIAECVDRSGSFLDIGCANGYLLQCLLSWTAEGGHEIEPHGLDISPKLSQMARERLPEHAHHIYTGNAWDWSPPRRYTYVRTELVYVPPHLQGAYAGRLLDEFVEPGGSLLVAEYGGRGITEPELPIVRRLADLGFLTERHVSGFWQGVEKTRVAVVRIK